MPCACNVLETALRYCTQITSAVTCTARVRYCSASCCSACLVCCTAHARAITISPVLCSIVTYCTTMRCIGPPTIRLPATEVISSVLMHMSVLKCHDSATAAWQRLGPVNTTAWLRELLAQQCVAPACDSASKESLQLAAAASQYNAWQCLGGAPAPTAKKKRTVIRKRRWAELFPYPYQLL